MDNKMFNEIFDKSIKAYMEANVELINNNKNVNDKKGLVNYIEKYTKGLSGYVKYAMLLNDKEGLLVKEKQDGK